MPTVKCVTFDLDNTIVDTFTYSKKVRDVVANYLKNELSGKYGKEVFSDISSTFSWIVERFGSNYNYHIDQLLVNYGLNPPDYKHLIDSAVKKYHKFRDKYFKLDPEVVGILKYLKSKKVVLGVITNGRSDKQREKLKYLGIEKYFDFVVVSDDIDVEKPGERIFNEALCKARKVAHKDLKTEECLHIGDKPKEDVLGPKKSGWKTIRVLSAYKHIRPEVPDEEADFNVEKPHQVKLLLEGLITA